MKKILLYSATLFGLLFASCVKSEEEMPVVDNRQKGEVSFSIHSADATRAEVVSDYLIRIYSENGLIRMYNSLEAMPESLALLSGNYTIDVLAGNSAPASFTNKTYHGKESFKIVAGQTQRVEVVCPLLNAAVVVNYSDAIVANFNDGFVTNVALGKNSLDYTTSSTGYFLPNETEKSIVWRFAGEHSEKGEISSEGTFDIEAGKKYTLNFNYSPDAPGFLDFTITVEEPTPENGGDVIIFSAEPQYKSTEFNMDEPQVIYGTTRTFTVSAPNALTAMEVEVDGQTYDLGNSTVAGVTVVKSDEKNWNVTVSEELFNSMTGGNHDLNFVATDAEGGEGKKTIVFVSQGIVPAEASDYDLWLNTGSIRVKIYDPSVSTVSVKLRREGNSWATYEATRQDENTFVATINPEWSTSTSVGGETVYLPDVKTGIFANSVYESQAIINGVEQPAVARFETSVEQLIPDASFEDSSLACFTNSNLYAPFWGSGNNSIKSGLCVQSTLDGMDGNYCVKMPSSAPMGMLAAGNLFTGTFEFRSDMNGTVRFGVDYNWEARPSAFRLKYHASIGKVNVTKYTDSTGKYPIANGEQDKARIYALIVDWSSQPGVTSGMSSPTGCFDPEASSTMSCGKVIAYASQYIDWSTPGNEMVTMEIPFEFYDKVAKPSSTYKLVISCTSNAYGDYMCGYDKNVLYVDDFEWVY